MHTELLSSLAAEHRYDLIAAMNVRRAPSVRAQWRAPHVTLPRLRVSWTRTSLSAVNNRGRGRSWVIVISATVPAGLAGDGSR